MVAIFQNKIFSILFSNLTSYSVQPMPELPEVEVTRKSFADAITGATIMHARQGKPLRWALGISIKKLHNLCVIDVRRRGKYIILDLSEGVLLLHLGMSGSLRFAQELPPPDTHDHFDLHTTHGTLRLNDPRRFGCVLYGTSMHDTRVVHLLSGLGVEPLGQNFQLDVFYQHLRARKAAIKQVLLAGKIVVGVGNIYACEALFHACIHPETPACKLSKKRVGYLRQAIRDVLHAAIEQGGSSLRNYSNADGKLGYFQLQTMVYGRALKPCRVCRRPIRLFKQGQRSTYFCSYCQKR